MDKSNQIRINRPERPFKIFWPILKSLDYTTVVFQHNFTFCHVTQCIIERCHKCIIEIESLEIICQEISNSRWTIALNIIEIKIKCELISLNYLDLKQRLKSQENRDWSLQSQNQPSERCRFLLKFLFLWLWRYIRSKQIDWPFRQIGSSKVEPSIE